MYPSGFHVTAVILSTAAFMLSNAPSVDHEQLHAQHVAQIPAAPEIARSSPEDVPTNHAEETASDLTSGPEPETQVVLPADPGPKSTPPEIPTPPAAPQGRVLNEVDQYLWSVYERSRTKVDGSGDFTWKDAAAAARSGFNLEKYVIGGMDRDFRELLFHLGHALDAAGIDWTILSGFRDDYRQSIAVGYKAHDDNSFHGGSAATGGYGHGCAVDIASADGASSGPVVWQWLDQHGEQFAVHRPMPQIDPAHVQPFGRWHEVAAAFRKERIENSRATSSDATADDFDDLTTPEFASSSGVSQAQFMCVRPHPLEAANRPIGLLAHALSHAKPPIVHRTTFYADRTHRNAKWHTAGEGRAPEQHRRAENLGHHFRSKPRLHVAERNVA